MSVSVLPERFQRFISGFQQLECDRLDACVGCLPALGSPGLLGPITLRLDCPSDVIVWDSVLCLLLFSSMRSFG